MKVIGFLKKEGGQKDEQLISLRGELGKVQDEAASERRALECQHQTTMGELEDQLQGRTEEVGVVESTPLSHAVSPAHSCQ